MKPIKTLLLLAAIIHNIEGQTLKSYVGPINSFKGEGKAKVSYQYFEDSEGNRILHGNYLYTENPSYTNSNKQITIKATFKNDTVNGLWQYCEKDLDNDQYSESEYLTGSYISGLLNGKWEYKSVNNNSKKITRNSIVYFTKNKLTGKFLYNDRQRGFFINGKFNLEGKFDSTWIIKYKDNNKVAYEDIRRYNDGILYARRYFDESTGRKLSNSFDYSNFIDLYSNNIAATSADNQDFTIVEKLTNCEEYSNHLLYSTLTFWLNLDLECNKKDFGIFLQSIPAYYFTSSSGIRPLEKLLVKLNESSKANSLANKLNYEICDSLNLINSRFPSYYKSQEQLEGKISALQLTLLKLDSLILKFPNYNFNKCSGGGELAKYINEELLNLTLLKKDIIKKKD